MMREVVISCFVLVGFFVVVFCEPLGYNYSPTPKEETEVEVQQVEVYEIPWIGDQQPQNTYDSPKPQYGPPPQEYGPPPEITTTEQSITTTTLNSDVLSTNFTRNQTERLEESKNNQSRGTYYIYHPTGLLQKVIYSTKDDSARMSFSAQLKYENVEPVKGPIYTYDPETYVFSRINRK